MAESVRRGLTSVPRGAFALRSQGSDADVITLSATEPQVFAAVFDRHFDAIRDYLARRLPAARADELAAETFLIAFERRSGYDPAFPSARPWLFGIATNLVGRNRRDEQRRMAAYARMPSGSQPDASDEIAARADAVGARSALSGALAALEAGDRDALLLQALADLTYSEIALALGIPTGTVRSRLHRARTQLAQALSLEGVTADG